MTTQASHLTAVPSGRQPFTITPAIDRALDEQREALWDVEAQIEVVAQALEAKYGECWPTGVPNYARILRAAAKLIDTATENLEGPLFQDRVRELEQEEPESE